MRRLIALLLVSLLFLGELLPVVAFAQTEAHVRITATSLNVRSGPGTDFEVLGSVKKGEVVVQLRESPGWVQIQLESGTIGWVSDKYVEVVETTPTPTPPTREPAATPPPPSSSRHRGRPAPAAGAAPPSGRSSSGAASWARS